jgi:hypothetical protein
MARELLFGKLHPDLACAIVLGFVESNEVNASLDSVTLVDPQTRQGRTQSGWLKGDDPLDLLTREYLTARLEATRTLVGRNASGWAAASAVKSREAANTRAIQAKAQARELLRQRGILDCARSAGMTVFESR